MSDDKGPRSAQDRDNIAEEQHIPIYREEVHINKETVITGTVNIKRNTLHRHIAVKESMHNQDVTVDVVPIGKYIDSIPHTSEQDGMTIIPVYEEHIQIVKRIYLKEEVRISKKETEHPFEQQIDLKHQVISITRDKK